MKKILIFCTILLSLCVIIFILHEKILSLQEKISISENNTKVLLLENSHLDSTSRMLKLSMDRLETCNDSISKLLINAVKANRVNKNKVTQLQYMLENNFRIDTVRFRDTLFINDTDIDTCITDHKGYSLDLKLKYPNTIIVNPKFRNEYITISSAQKETINPPRKFFLGRGFQKKHIVTEIKVVNNNPYGSIDTTRFIEIIKR